MEIRNAYADMKGGRPRKKTRGAFLCILGVLLLSAGVAGAQSAIGISIGQIVRAQLQGSGDERDYQISVPVGTRIFAVVHKSAVSSTDLVIGETDPPTSASVGTRDATDQIMDYVVPAAGVTYIRVAVSPSESMGCNYSLVVYDESTFPSIAEGATMANQALTGPGSCQWYQIPVTAGGQIFVFLEKSAPYSTSVSVQQGVLPPEGTANAASQAVSVEAVPPDETQPVAGNTRNLGFCYVRVQDEESGGNGCTYSITVQTVATFPSIAEGTTLANQSLSGPGDCHWYQVPITGGERIFVILDKATAYSTSLTVQQGALPPEGAGDSADQAVALNTLPQQSVGQNTGNLGFCYVRVQDEESGGNGCAYSITVHNEDTFPSLTVGQPLTGQGLDGNGDCQWYQIASKANQPLFVLLNKAGVHDALISISEDLLPGPGLAAAGDDQAIEIAPKSDGFCYVRIQDGQPSGAGTTFTVTAHDETTFPQLKLGSYLTGQPLDGLGACLWYQIPVSSGDAVLVSLTKPKTYNLNTRQYVDTCASTLGLSEGKLPDPGGTPTYADQNAGLTAQSNGFCYVRVESGNTTSFSFEIAAYLNGNPEPGKGCYGEASSGTNPALWSGDLLPLGAVLLAFLLFSRKPRRL